MANDIPEISKGARTPITSAGGSGGGGLGGIQYETSTTPDMTGVGAAIGALMGMMGKSSDASGKKDETAGGGGGKKAIEAGQKAVEELTKVIPVFDSNGNQVGTMQENTPFEPPSGYPDRFGNVYPKGIASVQNELIKLPPDVKNIDAQEYVNKIFGTVNGKPRYIASGIADPNTNTIVAIPNYNIGPDFSKFERGTSDLFEGGGYDPYESTLGWGDGTDFSEAITSPYDFSSEIDSSNITDLMSGTSPTIDMSGFDSSLFGGDFIDSLSPSFDSSSFDSSSFDSPSYDSSSWLSDIGSSLSDVGSSIGDFFGGWFAKDGGMATPMYAHGGEVQHFVSGGDASDAGKTSSNINIGGGLVGGGLGALIGALLSGKSTGQVSRGVDMSKVGVINPRTTTFGVGPTQYVPHNQYSAARSPAPFDYSQIYKNLGINVGMADGGSTSFYTYGTPVDANQILGTVSPMEGMKSGGLPKATAPVTPEGRHDYRHGQYVDGVGDGQSDDIPAMLADGEYVIDADTVAALGNGSNKAGAKVLDQLRHGVRAHKRSAPLDKIPPKAKSPLEYIRMGAKMKGSK